MFKIHSKASRKFENLDSSKPAQFSQLIVRSVRVSRPVGQSSNKASMKLYDENFWDHLVEEWVRSWWSDKSGVPWCKVGDDEATYESGLLKTLTPKDWFSLYEIKSHRLWIPPPAAMETVVELFNEDRLVNPHLAHVFVIPRLMTHLWRKQLFKDADVRFYVRAGAPFWPSSMHEPLTVLLVLPLAFVENYRGPWTVRDTTEAREFGELMDTEFGDPVQNGRRRFLDMDGPMPSLWEDKHRWTRDLLFEFLNKQSTFPPVQSGLLRSLLPALRGRSIPDSNVNGGRRRGKRVRDGGSKGGPLQMRQRRRSLDEPTL
eukprot:scaffold13420_cov135-Skeletonema_dohrnii-CCMP3373.AAC.1